MYRLCARAQAVQLGGRSNEQFVTGDVAVSTCVVTQIAVCFDHVEHGLARSNMARHWARRSGLSDNASMASDN